MVPDPTKEQLEALTKRVAELDVEYRNVLLTLQVRVEIKNKMMVAVEKCLGPEYLKDFYVSRIPLGETVTLYKKGYKPTTHIELRFSPDGIQEYES